MLKVARIMGLFGVVLICTTLDAVHADQVLTTPGLIITVDNETGRIGHIDVVNQIKGRAPRSVTVLAEGNLLSQDWLIQPRFLGNRIAKDEVGEPLVETRYANQGLTVLRHVSGGTSPYELSIRYQLINDSSTAIDLASMLMPAFHFASGFNELDDEGGGYGAWIYAYRDFFASSKNGAQRIDLEALKGFSPPEPVQWLGWVNRLYVMAIRLQPPGNVEPGVEETLSGKESGDKTPTPSTLVLTFTKASQALPERLEPGESTTIAFDCVIAPKQWDLLSSITPALDSVVLINLWEWFRWVCYVIWQLLSYLFKLSGNWGIAIILMALAVRVLIIPVTRISLHYQELASQQQERIKPLLKKVREEYSGIERSQQVVALYEREKYDQLAPFKGMLGLFVQIPVLIALFNVLGEAPELSGVPFLWFDDLSLSDRLFPLGIDLPFFGAYFNLLPFFMAGVTVLSTFYAARTSVNKTRSGSLFGMAALFLYCFTPSRPRWFYTGCVQFASSSCSR